MICKILLIIILLFSLSFQVAQNIFFQFRSSEENEIYVHKGALTAPLRPQWRWVRVPFRGVTWFNPHPGKAWGLIGIVDMAGRQPRILKFFLNCGTTGNSEEPPKMGFLCVREGEESLMCNGTLYDRHEEALNYKDGSFWVYLGVYIALVLFAGESAYKLYSFS